MGEVTVLLEKWKKGDLEARNQAFEIVYKTLKKIASRKLQNRQGELILQPTVLVNEAFIKLANQQKININDRQHFLAIAARVIFQIILDYRKEQSAVIRGGAMQRVTFSGLQLATSAEFDILALNEALEEFTQIDERAAYLFQLKYILGFSTQEMCEDTKLGHSTIEADLKMARFWLSNRLKA